VIGSQASGPVFRRIAADLRAEIAAGQIRPGQLLPSETRLSQQYGVSRLTARAAVNVLRAEGLGEHINGRGVVVREPAEVEELTLPADAAVDARMPTPEERDAYDVPDGTPIFSVSLPDGSVEIYPADRWRLRSPRG
jgi:GntR family transcriptional regulator